MGWANSPAKRRKKSVGSWLRNLIPFKRSSNANVVSVENGANELLGKHENNSHHQVARARNGLNGVNGQFDRQSEQLRRVEGVFDKRMSCLDANPAAVDELSVK